MIEPAEPPFFPMARRCPSAPPPEYARMRAEGPLARVAFYGGPAVWVVTRHAEARRLLNDPRISTDPNRPGHPLAAIAGSARDQAGQFIDMDPPAHTFYRRMLISDFSVKRVRELRPEIERVAGALVDDMLGGDGADLVSAYGRPLATLVICRLLGVPYEDRAFFHERTRAMVEGRFEGASIQAREELLDYLGTQAERAEHARRAGQADGVLGRLAERRAAGELTRDEVAGMAFLLLVAGHETTAGLLTLGAFTLLRHPAVLDELMARPDLWPRAVDELLRFHSIVDWSVFDLVAVADVPVGDQVIRAGEGLFVLAASANHDERAFDRPGEFDIHRGGRHHLAFGYGPHQCLGQHLGRAELEIGLRTLFERVPALRVAIPAEELPFRYEDRMFGLYALPVAW